jgi:hypothetical protein
MGIKSHIVLCYAEDEKVPVFFTESEYDGCFLIFITIEEIYSVYTS